MAFRRLCVYGPTPAVSSRRGIELTRVDTRGRVRAIQGKYIVRPRPIPPRSSTLARSSFRGIECQRILANSGTPNIVTGKGPLFPLGSFFRNEQKKKGRGTRGERKTTRKQKERRGEEERQSETVERRMRELCCHGRKYCVDSSG